MGTKPYSFYPLRLGSSILIYWAGYQAFFRYIVLKDRILLRKEIRIAGPARNIDLADKEDKRQNVFNEIDSYIVDNQKFMDPLLSLESLSEDLGMGTINKYRVEQSKQLLSDSHFSAYTIVAIGMECGFNSKSTFYSAFKKFTGQTPSTFRKKTSS